MMFQMTIADVLRHEGGMPVFSQQINIEDCFPENIHNNNVGKIIEEEELKFPEGDYRYVIFSLTAAMPCCGGGSTTPSPEVRSCRRCSGGRSLTTRLWASSWERMCSQSWGWGSTWGSVPSSSRGTRLLMSSN